MADKNNQFYESVFDVVRQIPYGRATSYGAIAAYLGAKRSSRLVGWAMNMSHEIYPIVPAHRVVNRNGLLTGKMHFKDENEMQRLLENEGLIVKDNQIQNFSDVFWDPFSLDHSL
jgi:methylated-DNA-protein-cysteine methyltransferase-like protein